MYRPQFAYRMEAGFEDRDFRYCFDSTNTPLLNNASLASNGLILNIPLILQSDAPFFWKNIQVNGLDGADPVVAAQFQDPYRNNLTQGYVPLDLSVAGNGADPGFGILDIALEPGIKCPAGAVILVSLQNQTNATQDITKVRITLGGTKRYVAKGVRCAA